MRRLLSILALAIVALPAYPQTPVRALPDNNLAIPLLITFKNSTGSGFYVKPSKDVYLVTAKHVLFGADGKILEPSFNVLSYSNDLADETPNSITVDTTKAAANIVPHPSEDVAVVKLFSDNPSDATALRTLDGVTAHTMAKNGNIINARLATLRKFSDVLVGNDVFLLGFPTSLGLQTMPQIDPHRPLLRKGIVAGLNQHTHSIILDCPAYFGNSGGPVIEADQDSISTRQYNIIGVVNQYVPYADGGKTFFIMTNSGYSVATPMDYVLELVK